MLTIKIKPMKSTEFDLEMPPGDTVGDLKKRIVDVRPELSSQMKLVYTGRVLCDETALKDVGIKPNFPMVVVASKKRLADSHTESDPQEEQPTQAAQEGYTSVALQTTAPEAPPSMPPTAAVHDNAVLAPVLAHGPSVDTPGDFDVSVQHLCELGFDRGDVEQCLRLAFGNPDRAAEYLMTGVPAGLQSRPQQPLDPVTEPQSFRDAFEEVAQLDSTQRVQHIRDTMESIDQRRGPMGIALDRTGATSVSNAETDWEVQTDNGWQPWRPGILFQGQSGEHVQFQLGRHLYTASFHNDRAGVQANVATGKQRALRRRPQLVLEPGICGRDQLLPLQAHEAEFLVPNCGGFAAGQSIRSEIKLVGDFRFRFLVFPRGTISTQGVQFSAFVEAVPPEDIADTRWQYPHVKYQITLINWIDYRQSVTKADTWSFQKEGVDRGWHDMVPVADLTVEKGWIGPQGTVLLRASCFCPYAVSHRLEDYSPQKELGLAKWTKNEPLPTALLQSLSHIIALKPLLNSSQFASPILALLQDLFRAPDEQGAKIHTCNPESVLQSLGWHGLESWGGKGAGEMLAALCSALGNNSIKQLFQCELENYIECCDVDFRSSRCEPCYGFKLPLLAPDGSQLRGVMESLQQVFAEEMLDGDNMYDAEGHGKQRARKGVRISRLPPVVVLEVARCSFDIQTMKPTFLENAFEFPTVLNLADFLSDSTTYALHTVISHDTKTGNYNAHIRAKPDSSFVKYLDDGNVVPCTEYSAVASKFGTRELLVWNYFDRTPEQIRAVPTPTRTRSEFACVLVYVCEHQEEEERLSAQQATTASEKLAAIREQIGVVELRLKNEVDPQEKEKLSETLASLQQDLENCKEAEEMK